MQELRIEFPETRNSIDPSESIENLSVANQVGGEIQGLKQVSSDNQHLPNIDKLEFSTSSKTLLQDDSSCEYKLKQFERDKPIYPWEMLKKLYELNWGSRIEPEVIPANPESFNEFSIQNPDGFNPYSKEFYPDSE